MMVKLKSIYAGPNGNYPAGAVVQFSDKEGQQLVDGGYGANVQQAPAKKKPTEKQPELETASIEPEENAMQQPARRRRKPRLE